MNKVEGKVADFCPKCKNCKDIRWEYDGKNAAINMTSVTCEDPYDGLTREMFADDEIRCSMFEQKPPCETCERFDGLYCHRLKGITTPSCTSSFGKPGNCPSYEEKKETHETKTAHEIELEAKIMALLSEKSHMEETIAELNQTTSDQEITIKALLLTIKEMCKEENENA